MRDDEASFIYSYVQFPPLSRAAHSVLGCGPRTFTDDLQTSTVDDQMDRPARRIRPAYDAQRVRPSRQRAVIRNGQVIETEHPEQ